MMSLAVPFLALLLALLCNIALCTRLGLAQVRRNSTGRECPGADAGDGASMSHRHSDLDPER
jgi:hypothetical protein